MARTTLKAGAASLNLLLLLGAILGAVALQGCDRLGPQTPDAVSAPAAALPLSAGPGLPMADAPLAQALPQAPPAPVERLFGTDSDYAYLDSAAYMSDAFFDAPPDYAFAYEGVYPWAWRADDDALVLVEPIAGGYRAYYYQPGAALPFLVRDPQYAYGFDQGRLAAVYDGYGRALPPVDVDQRSALAGRYLARAQALNQAARAPGRRAVDRESWLARRGQIGALSEQWSGDRARTPAWRAFHAEYAPQQQARWAPERYRREAVAARVFKALDDRRAADRHWRAALAARNVEAEPLPLPPPKAERRAAQTALATALATGRPTPTPAPVSLDMPRNARATMSRVARPAPAPGREGFAVRPLAPRGERFAPLRPSGFNVQVGQAARRASQSGRPFEAAGGSPAPSAPRQAREDRR
jgi:hypothetical protein